MVSLVPCGDMEPEAGEPQEKASETFTESVRHAISVTGDKQDLKSEETILQPCQVLQEPIVELQRRNVTGEEDEKTTMEVTEDKEGSEKKDTAENKEAEEMREMKCTENVSDDPSKKGTDELIISNTNFTTPVTKESYTEKSRKLTKTPSFGKTVRFKETEAVEERVDSWDSLFPDYEVDEWTTTSFEELFTAEDWVDITDDRLLRKKVLQTSPDNALTPALGQEVTLKMQGVLDDKTVVEKDCKLVFVIGEGDVNQALEECVISMKKGEIALMLADSQYTYGLLGREPDIPAWAPILYQLQLLDFRDKPDPLSLPIPDRIRIANQKRERGNFYFQREEYSMAAQAYCMALDDCKIALEFGNNHVSLGEHMNKHTLKNKEIYTDLEQLEEGQNCVGEEEEEVNDYRVKCLNNLAAAQLKLGHFEEALHTSQDVLFLDPHNVKALFRKGKLLSDKGEYEEAMETLKKALKLEPSTKAIHAELSKLVKIQAGCLLLFQGISWKFLLGALVVALGSLVTSVVLTARN